MKTIERVSDVIILSIIVLSIIAKDHIKSLESSPLTPKVVIFAVYILSLLFLLLKRAKNKKDFFYYLLSFMFIFFSFIVIPIVAMIGLFASDDPNNKEDGKYKIVLFLSFAPLIVGVTRILM